MRTITAISFKLVHDADEDILVPVTKGKVPPFGASLTDAQKALWKDYTGEDEGKPYQFGERTDSDKLGESLLSVSISRSKDRRHDKVTLFGGVYTLVSVTHAPKPAPGIEQALRARSTGRNERDGYCCCLTGKDADLEPHGEQHIKVIGYLGGNVLCEVSIGKSFAGSDVSLNLPEGMEEDEALYAKAKDAYLEQAGEIVIGCSVAGEWDGDGWYMHDVVPFSVSLRGRKTLGKMADAIVAKAQEVLKPLERELRLADTMLEQLAGWTDGKGNAYPAGQPGEGSVGFWMTQDEAS